MKPQRETNRFKDGDSVSADVSAGSHTESSDETGTQITETQRGVTDRQAGTEGQREGQRETDLRMSPYRLGITRTSNCVGS